MDQLETSVRTFAATEPWQGEAPEGCFPNFLGVMTQRAFVADYAPSNSLLTVNGEANLTPAPTFNDGEIFFEQAAIHNAVMAASAQFIMVELGGGFAARTVDATPPFVTIPATSNVVTANRSRTNSRRLAWKAE